MVLKQSEQAQVEQDAALESEAGAAAARLRDSIAETRATVLITAHNPAFRDFYRAGGDRYAMVTAEGPTMDRVNGALLYLSALYPKSIVQASFIDGGGAENARIVRGTREAPQLLTTDVSQDAFFRPALELPHGHVTSRGRISRALRVSGSSRTPHRFRVAPDRRSSMSSSGSRAFAANSASRTTASRSPSSMHAQARSFWTTALRSRPAPSSACRTTLASASSLASPATAFASSATCAPSTGRWVSLRTPKTTGSSLSPHRAFAPRACSASTRSRLRLPSSVSSWSELGWRVAGCARARTRSPTR